MNLKTSVVFAAAGYDLFEQMSRANRPAVADPVGIPATTEENMQQGQQHQQQQQQATTTKVCLLDFLEIFPNHLYRDLRPVHTQCLRLGLRIRSV